jgi:hypothetical protein
MGKCKIRDLTGTAHFTKTNVPIIGFDFNDRPNKATPVRANSMKQWRFQRYCHGC